MSAVLLAEIEQSSPQAVEKCNYSHADMIDFIIAHPGCTQNDLAARYGYTAGWVSRVMSSDAWGAMMAKRRGELVDPTLVATINERFTALADRSLTRLMEKLDQPVVSDNVVLKAVELGAKALGVGGNAAPTAPAADHLAQLANRLLDLQTGVRARAKLLEEGVIDGEVKVVSEAGEVSN